MANRVYPDMKKLRAEVNDLIDKGRVRVHPHARTNHPDLSSLEQIAIVRYGTRTKPDRDRPASDGVYVCWATLPGRRLCRAVFCVEQLQPGENVLVITAFED
jgi:hypothetical protein